MAVESSSGKLCPRFNQSGPASRRRINDGTEGDAPINYKKSIEFLEKAKAMGDADAQRHIDYLKEISSKHQKTKSENL